MARKPQPANLRLLSKVSRLYYEQNLKQSEISDRLRLSKPKVSRLLQRALEHGVVKITVHSPPGVYAALEDQIETLYGMKEVIIADVADLDVLLERGAVGDIVLRYFDIRGQPVISELDSRVIGITLDQLKNIPCVVGVAGGPQKHEAVWGALKGGFIDVLITDEQTARFLLEA